MAAGEYVTTSTEELAERIDVAARRFADLAGEVGPDRVVGTWTSGEVVAHLVNVVNRYNEFNRSRLASAPRGVDEVNRRELEAFTDAPMESLLSELDRGMEQFRERWGPARGITLDTPFPFHGGATIDFQSGMTNLVGEFLVHGWDVAPRRGSGGSIDEHERRAPVRLRHPDPARIPAHVQLVGGRVAVRPRRCRPARVRRLRTDAHRTRTSSQQRP